MRGLRSAIALLVVLIGLGAYIYFVTSKQTDDTGTTKQEKVFTALEPDKVEEITVKSESGDVTTVKKQGEGWQIVSPIAGRASETDVSGITSALGQVDIGRVLDENPADLKEYGLDKPRIEIRFKSSDAKSSGTLLVGAKTATGANLYAKRNDEKRVLLISSAQETSFNKSTFDLRDKTLITFQRDALDGIDIAADGKTIQLAKANDAWRLTKPIAARADSSAAEGVAGRIETAQMKSIVTNDATPADLKKYGLDKPAVSVTLNLGGARATLALGGKAGEDDVYARDATKSVVVTVEKALADDLKKGAEDYRRKDLFDYRAYTATRIELIRGGKSVVFDRVKGTGENATDVWRRTSPSPADPAKDKIEGILTGLADFRAVSFTDSKANTGLDAPALTVKVKFDEGKKEESVSFGRNGKDVYASTVDPGAAKIETERFDEAMKTLDELSK